jgi:hypothetical protein
MDAINAINCQIVRMPMHPATLFGQIQLTIYINIYKYFLINL